MKNRYIQKLFLISFVFSLGIFEYLPGQVSHENIEISPTQFGDPAARFIVKLFDVTSDQGLPEIAEFRINHSNWIELRNPRFQVGGQTEQLVYDGAYYLQDSSNYIETRFKWAHEESFTLPWVHDKLIYEELIVSLSSQLHQIDDIVINDKPVFDLKIKIKPFRDSGKNKTKAVYLSLNGLQTKKEYDPPQAGELTYGIKYTSLDGIRCGNNLLKIWAKGDLPDEISDTLIIYLFHFNVKFPPESYPNKDTLIQMFGCPSGGWFSGPGIVGKTNYFNPKDAGAGTHLFKYRYFLKGDSVSTSGYIEVIEGERITIVSEDHVVCANSNHAEYESYDSYEKYKWTVTGGQIIGENSLKKIRVEWGVSGLGIVKLEGLSSTNIIINQDIFLVEIKCAEAYENPTIFWGDKNKTLLICNQPSAQKYVWIKNDEKFNETTMQFVYIDDNIYEDDLFKVEVISSDECISVSEAITINKGYFQTEIWNIFSVHPLQVTRVDEEGSKLDLIIDNCQQDQVIFEIYNLIGTKLITNALTPIDGRAILELRTNLFSPGVYLVRIIDGNRQASEKYFINN